MTVYIEDLINAIDWSDDAVVNTKTGAILMLGDQAESMIRRFETSDRSNPDVMFEGLGWRDDELANYVLNEDDYIALPSQYDVHEYHLMERFIERVENEEKRDTLWMAIDGKGAFRRFENTLDRYGMLNDWWNFKEQHILEMAKAWCAKNSVPYAYQYPERVLLRRKFTKAQVSTLEDADAKPGDMVYHNGIFDINVSSLYDDMRDEPWGFEFEEVDIDVSFWLSHFESEGNTGARLDDDILLFELSPDRRIAYPDDKLALFFCCNLVDGIDALKAAEEAGKETAKAKIVPMEVHESYICANRKAYAKYWNGKIDDLVHDIEGMKKSTPLENKAERNRER